jgi:hypothetical protein
MAINDYDLFCDSDFYDVWDDTPYPHADAEDEKEKMIRLLERLTGGLPPETKFTEANKRLKEAQLKNLTSAIARYISEKGRIGLMLTLTFNQHGRISFEFINEMELMGRATIQHSSLMAFLYKLRRSKRIKKGVRYMATLELQGDGNMHMHIIISVHDSDLYGLFEFVYDFKDRYRAPYDHQGKRVYPIGRLHIGISVKHRQRLQDRYIMKEYRAKSDPSRRENFIVSLEERRFEDGDWTPVEFYDEKMIRDRYETQIAEYLVKTVSHEYALDEHYVKEGVAKCQLGHDIKTLLTERYLARLQVRFIRMVGKRVYTHSNLPFRFELYQRYYRELTAYNAQYKVYYNCIKAVQEKKLHVIGDKIFDAKGNDIIEAVRGKL